MLPEGRGFTAGGRRVEIGHFGVSENLELVCATTVENRDATKRKMVKR